MTCCAPAHAGDMAGRPPPVVGSSRKRMEGEEMSAHAMFSRRFSPPDRPRTRMPPGSAPPTWSIHKRISGDFQEGSASGRLTGSATRMPLGSAPPTWMFAREF